MKFRNEFTFQRTWRLTERRDPPLNVICLLDKHLSLLCRSIGGHDKEVHHRAASADIQRGCAPLSDVLKYYKLTAPSTYFIMGLPGHVTAAEIRISKVKIRLDSKGNYKMRRNADKSSYRLYNVKTEHCIGQRVSDRRTTANVMFRVVEEF